MSDSSIVGLAVGFVLFIIIGFLLISLFTYITTSLALFKAAKRENISEAFLAWIPFGNLYVYGKVIQNINFFGLHEPVEKAEVVMLVGSVAGLVTGVIPIIGAILSPIASICFVIIMIAASYSFFLKYKPDKAVLFTILSFIFFPLIGVFMLFALKE